jgi:MYXO-CTERM domain-containing protein
MKLIATTIVSAALVCAANAGNLVTNGDFETGDFTGWSVFGTDTGDMFVSGGGYFGGADTTNVAFLGSIGGDGYIQQTLTNAPGIYTISFDYASDGLTPNDLNVYWDGNLVATGTDLFATDFTYFSEEVLGTGDDTLTFGGRNDPGFNGLDNVSVTASTPSPAAALPMLGGLIGLARRRRK